jgi:fermentation-respiration switch protein FrsA (DUF1100 family)
MEPMLLAILAAVGGLALAGLITVLGIATWIAHKMTQVERYPVFGHPSQFGLAHEEVIFPSRRDKVPLSGWYLPSAPDTRCIILIQGQEHHRNSRGIRALELGRDLAQNGFSVLLFDFRGRGESGGKRDSGGDREQWDVLGAIDYVTSRGIPPEMVGLLGFSLGAGVALLVAVKEPRIPAIVCDSAFLDSMEDLRRMPFLRLTLPSWFARPIALAGRWFFAADFSKVRPIEAITKMAPRPIFFIHGHRDGVTSYRESQTLYEAAGGSGNQIWIVPDGGHVSSYRSNPQEYVAKVVAFLRAHLVPAPAAAPNTRAL